MADTTPNPFQDALNDYIATAQAKQKPQRRTTSPVSMITDTASEYPRASLTAAGVGGAVYKGVKGWKQAYNEGLKVISERMTAEGKMVGELGKKGITAIQRLEGGKDALHAAAREYALEKTFTGFPFYNKQAADRLADLKTGRVILTGEKIPIAGSTKLVAGPESLLYSDPRITVTPKQSGVGIAIKPKQVTLETAKGIPKIDLTARTGSGETGAIEEAQRFSDKPTRTTKTPKYRPKISPNPALGRRIAELSTGGVLGKTNIGLEAAAGLYDIVREEGPVRTAYRSEAKHGNVAGGIVLGGLAATSRAGRSAMNMISAGAPEFLGAYDTIDLLQARNEARQRYMTLRGTQGYPAMNYPVIKEGNEFVPVSDNPYLQMIEAQVMAEKGIESSPIIEDYYKGPEYNYAVQNGKVVAMMKPEYAALYDEESQRRIVNMNRNRGVLNVDPTLGPIGYIQHRPEAYNFGNYVDYMTDR